MKKIKAYIEAIKEATHKTIAVFRLAWACKHLIITLTLFVSLFVESGLATMYLPEIPEVNADVIAYNVNVENDAIDASLERRALELFEINKDVILEQYRQEAITEHMQELLSLSTASPFVDYDELEAKFGY